jgi:hypothetical protein
MPHIRSTGLCCLCDKTKGAQYEEDDEARVKLLYDKTKGAQYVSIIEDNNEAGGTATHGVQYYLNNWSLFPWL